MTTHIEQEFNKALQKVKKRYQTGKIDKYEFNRLSIWTELLKAKKEAQREQNAKPT